MKEERRIYLNRIRRKRQLRRRMIIAGIILCLLMIFGVPGTVFLSRASAEEPAVSYKYYTSILVYPGDTLNSIAGTYADSHYKSLDAYIEEVRMTNHLPDDDIRAGEYLVVPYYSSDYR